jgi:hypothetical protein
MPQRQSRPQKETVRRVMHEFKHGELRIRGRGPKVKNPKQAIAIALREAGASNRQSPKEKSRVLRKTKAKERRGETAQAAAEGTKARRAGKTRSELYRQAQRRGIPGRSRMSKSQLERALRR